MSDTTAATSRQPGPMAPWVPTPSEVAQIVEEMRPIIAAFAERYRREQSDPRNRSYAA